MSTGTAGIGVNDFTVTPGGDGLCAGEVAAEPGARVEGAGDVRVTVEVACEGIRLPNTYAPPNRAAHTMAMASSERRGNAAPGEPVDPAPRADVPAITKSSWLPAGRVRS